MKKYYSRDQLNKLSNDRAIILCKNKIYDVTDFVNLHPGNIIILNYKDKDNFINYKFHSKKAKKKWREYFIGYLK